MAIYKIYMRSFAPWHEFGALIKSRTAAVPVPPSMGRPPIAVPVTVGGPFHGDGRGLSINTTSPAITSRVNTHLEVDLSSASAGSRKAWCDETSGPWMAVGPQARAFGKVDATFSVSKKGPSVKAVVEYGASNPLVKGSPDINARGEFLLVPGSGDLIIDAIITGDQFPACEAFIADPGGTKIFLGGFAPDSKEQILRLYGTMNDPEEIWFESNIVVKVDATGSFQDLQGGGSGSNSTGPVCEALNMSVIDWNARIMGSIRMPFDAP